MIAATETSVGGRLPIGTSLGGRYTITGLVRDDGSSTLYTGRIAGARGKPVMIKESVPADFVSAENRESTTSRFSREVQMLQSLKHPALSVVLDAFSRNDRHYLVMSYAPGETLETMLARRGCPFPEEDVVGWTLEILSALGVMHRHDPPVIYRNLKPASLIIDPSGALRLVDFGLARYFRQGQSRDTGPVGVAGYAPPEQMAGATDPRSDLYALGMTMQHLLTNQHPALSSPGLTSATTLTPTISSDLAAIIARAKDPDPNRRWPTAAEMELALRRHALTYRATGRLSVVPAPPSRVDPEASSPTARLVIYAAGLTSGRDEAILHLRRLTWMTPGELEGVLAHLPAIVPLVEPYRASLHMLKCLGIEARPIWPLRGLHALDEEKARTLELEGRVEVDDPAAGDDGVCLCRHCRFGWMLDDPAAPPAQCPSCRRTGWSAIVLVRCHRCGHEDDEQAAGDTCPCCGLTRS